MAAPATPHPPSRQPTPEAPLQLDDELLSGREQNRAPQSVEELRTRAVPVVGQRLAEADAGSTTRRSRGLPARSQRHPNAREVIYIESTSAYSDGAQVRGSPCACMRTTGGVSAATRDFADREGGDVVMMRATTALPGASPPHCGVDGQGNTYLRARPR